MYSRTIHWNDLPHDNYLGNGTEGLVLRLSETETIKIYSPESATAAYVAVKNAKLLKSLGFVVPEVKDFVKIELTEDAKLPQYTGRIDPGLHPVGSVAKTVPAVVKEYFSGNPLGTFNPRSGDLENFGQYLSRLSEHGMAFREGTCLDFIAIDDGRLGLVDCTTLVQRSYFDGSKESFESFDEFSMDFESRVIGSLQHELRYRDLLDLPTSVKMMVFNFKRMFKW